MWRLFAFYSVLLIALLILALKSFVFVKPDERAVVFRLGQFAAVHSAGVVLVAPFLDKVVKIRVEQIAGWDRMSEAELLARIANIYRPS